ncbi:MAG: 2-oxoglutarate dehydrogenase E1 component [Chloroflexi bacterium]|nr:2-oxoglutarate dehydrogenase E1 component [Chloroflexota bacterium]
MDIWSDYYGPNAGYVIELYERYLDNPQSVDAVSRSIFDSWQIPESEKHVPDANIHQIVAAVNYIQAIRSYGHLSARLDPLGHTPPGDPSLDLATYNLTESDLLSLPASIVSSPVASKASNALEAIRDLRAVYCQSVGYDYGHIHITEERDWLRETAESGCFCPPNDPVDPLSLLDRLTQVETFEQFLHRIFPGKTRFSIEGLDMLIPMLDEVIGSAVDGGICTILIGMAHRGRLNVLAHVLEKSYTQILAEFRDATHYPNSLDQLGWTGDINYHKGARRALQEGKEIKLIITMPPNPSHLEYVNPVIEGMARASDSNVQKPGAPEIYPMAALPILIHGDAAFPGEGIAAETLNFSRLPGYTTGGTIHIIANNQLGYTTPPQQGRSTLYASDLAKGFEIPIIHVNADDPLACIEAARTAFAYRNRFGKDFLIDLVGYRRYGHNEGDEPGFTQPLMYTEIDAHPSVRKIWADRLIQQELIAPEEPDAKQNAAMRKLQQTLEQLKSDQETKPPAQVKLGAKAMESTSTGVALPLLEAYNQSLRSFTQGFTINRKLERSVQRRLKIFEDPDQPSIDWSTAEELALASILADGVPIRMTGQDVERGTFSQRHAVFHDPETGLTYTPLQSFEQSKAAFEIQNSPLSESAALGFEYGYSIIAPFRLVIWEAQYGDFVNGAQTMIDEFISSAKAKWELNPSLVLLLPHGYEGQGPDHSSARPERFLSVATAHTLRVANPTTAAQYFHLLRLQVALLKREPLPLIVFTPKSLLRNPFVASSPRELSDSRWMPVLDDPGIQEAEAIRRVLFCTGKIGVELLTHELRKQHGEVAVVRVEQLVPFPDRQIKTLLERYPGMREVFWVQEEPENMGAWNYIHEKLAQLMPVKLPLGYAGRPESSSPSEGSHTWHEANQQAIINQAYNGKNLALETTGVTRGVKNVN